MSNTQLTMSTGKSTHGRPLILGGQLAMSPTAIVDILNTLRLHQSSAPTNAVYVLLEAVDQMRFDVIKKFYDDATKSWSFDQELVERLRIFSHAADFELRRDADTLYWRFITDDRIDGQVEQMPQGVSQIDLPFEVFPLANQLKPQDIRLLLWGSRESATVEPLHYWYDERVASSRVTYPADSNSKRVYIFGTEYIADGITQFTRWRGLEGAE